MTCAPGSDSTTGLWQSMHSTLCPAEGCGSKGEWWRKDDPFLRTLLGWLFSTGVVTSPDHPNHPGVYSHNLKKTQTIKVKQGLLVSLHFTRFTLYDNDYLSITDGDGTTLMGRTSGYTKPANITSRTNVLKLLFTTNEETTRTGWSVNWSAVTPGAFTFP